MSRLIDSLLALCVLATAADITVSHAQGNSDEPLLLTRYIENGRIREARQKAEVHHEEFGNVKSYAGFITTNKTYNSNAFFWFVLSQTNPRDDPVILYSNGGPGVPVLSVLFNNNGPFIVTKDQHLLRRNHTLTTNHSVIYLEIPVGTGYSYTDNELGYLRTQDDVARYVIAFLEQFYQLFPEQRKNDLYSAGCSYAGRFAVTTSRAVREYNHRAEDKINLRGIILGNAFIDLVRQQSNREFLYHIGLIDWNERENIKKIDDRMAKLDERSPEYLTEVVAKYEMIVLYTNFSYIFNYLTTNEPEDTSYYMFWVQTPRVRRALHVGERKFVGYLAESNRHFADDIRISVAPVMAEAMEDHKVLSYSGQLDMHFPYSATQELYRSLEWSGAREYRAASKQMWYHEGTLAGYRKRVQNFEEAIVRNAGHIADYEQPAWVCDLVTQFTRRK
ncbi:venom serine carboxypeptidase-like [Copidosoma floridanum]|uniref:venom serine carboxypeptidase-like n=1 Tax=Copidosoma floridanum TaxID=29053 RepID=UPI0006C99018|nr:venom serine carboxypeptidase-like [Copidosoma floridanum]